MIECTLKISELVQPERNVRMHTEQQLKEFERSVKMFGQIRPIVVDENNCILAGNGLYETFVRMGVEEAKVYKFENLNENQKKKLMIADNRIYALGVDDLESINEILSELVGDLDVPGFDEEMLNQMMADEDEITEVISEYGKLDEDEIAMVREHGERKEATIQKKMEAQSTSEVPAGTALPVVNTSFQPGEENSDFPETTEKQEMQKFVICPKCGERIWL